MHSVPLISTIAVGLGVALVLGFAAARLKLPAIVGYMLAGVIVGPATPGFVADVDLAGQLAEIGVILLMFGVGLHFSLADLLAVKRIAVPGAIAQIVVATAMGMLAAAAWGWSLGAGFVLGLALSVASTVVLLRALEERNALSTTNGHIAVGWLVVEDLAMVVVLVVLPALAGWLGGTVDATPDENVYLTLGKTLGLVAMFVALMTILGRRVFPWLLWQVAGLGSRELFTLCVIATAIGIAYGSAVLFGVSFALGAFFAGTVMRGSALSLRAAEETLPLRDAFSVLFFLSVGMLFDPATLVDQPVQVATVVAIIVFGKSLAACALVLALRYPLGTALTVSASLAQIGEFSFILAALGTSLGLLPREGQSLIVAGALISIALNPLLFRAVDPLHAWLLRHSRVARRMELPADPLAELPMTTPTEAIADHVVVAGYGRVGRRIVEALVAARIPVVVAEQNRERVEQLRQRHFHAVAGDTTQPEVLVQAHVARARMLVVATPDSVLGRKTIDIARTLRPGIHIVVRTHSDDEAKLLAKENGVQVFMGERELALGMTRHVLSRYGTTVADADPPA